MRPQGITCFSELGEAGAPARAYRSYGTAGQKRGGIGDADADGVPNLGDNCLGELNAAQADADRGYGDACDQDLTGDNRVDWQGHDAGVSCPSIASRPWRRSTRDRSVRRVRPSAEMRSRASAVIGRTWMAMGE